MKIASLQNAIRVIQPEATWKTELNRLPKILHSKLIKTFYKNYWNFLQFL